MSPSARAPALAMDLATPSSAAVAIRQAEPDDAAALASFGLRTYVAHYGSFWSTVALRDYLARHFSVPGVAAELADPTRVRVLLAEDAGGIVGYAKLVHERPVPLHPDERGTELEKLYVASGRTGQGIGSQLVAHAGDLALALGNPVLWLDVLKSNFSGIRLYRRLGFRIRGELPFATDLRNIGMWVMTRP